MFETKIGGVKMKNKKGFTLVELLVVIAIIGILSSVAVVNLNGARDKARGAAVLSTLSQLTTGILLCFDESTPLALQTSVGVACNNATAPTPNTPICAGSSTKWPDVDAQADGWEYVANCSSTPSAGTWIYAATGNGRTVTCTHSGCTQ